MEREVLIRFDLLLVVVFGLLLYSISARDPLAPPGLFDWIQLTLVGTALVVDVLALWATGRLPTSTSSPPGRRWSPFSSPRCSGSPERAAAQQVRAF